jgi:hypothetical protein
LVLVASFTCLCVLYGLLYGWLKPYGYGQEEEGPDGGWGWVVLVVWLVKTILVWAGGGGTRWWLGMVGAVGMAG